MPARNIVKQFGAHQYYHVYSRGLDKQSIFLDEYDYLYFLNLFKRYLSLNPVSSKRHGTYPHFANRAQLLCFCLMPNHVHLLVYQEDERAMTELMRALMTSYSMYFNHKYKRTGPVFQSNYKASRITTDSYLQHVSRYIHLNPKKWRAYDYSSLPYYRGERSAEWLNAANILDIFSNDQAEYLRFVADYEDQKQILDDLKWELADT